jgi:periplasmic protein TonB
MTRRWWGGPGISLVLHAALFLVLVWLAGRPSSLDATGATPSRRTRFIHVVTPGRLGGPGGATTAAAGTPRPARVPDTRPLDVVAPRTIENVATRPVAAVPAITTEDITLVPGAPMPVDGTTPGAAVGSGAGAGRGPGMGPGAGPGVGDVYEAGVGGVSDPKLIHEVKPSFTIDAMRAKIQGIVVLEVVVRADGTVDPASVRVTRSLDPGLDREAVNAVRAWRFRPSLRLGQPVASRVVVELAFTLR